MFEALGIEVEHPQMQDLRFALRLGSHFQEGVGGWGISRDKYFEIELTHQAILPLYRPASEASHSL